MTAASIADDPLWGHEGVWTEEEFLAFPTDGPRLELLDGALLVSPRPVRLHQRIVLNLAHLLKQPAAAMGGEALPETEVRLRLRTVLTPDVVVFRNQSDARITDAKHVLLAVEVVSPGSRPQDRILKPNSYAEAGIPFYLRVEPLDETGDVELFCYELREGAYEETVKGSGGGMFQLDLGDFMVEFDPAELLEY